MIDFLMLRDCAPRAEINHRSAASVSKALAIITTDASATMGSTAENIGSFPFSSPCGAVEEEIDGDDLVASGLSELLASARGLRSSERGGELCTSEQTKHLYLRLLLNIIHFSLENPFR